MAINTHTCPDCELRFPGPSALADHALKAHVDAPTPSAHIRPVKNPGAWKAATIGLIGLAVVAVVALVALGLSGAFDKETAPQQPGTAAHRVASSLKESGEIETYRSVEPDDGWEAEYELDESDGVVRSRGTGEDEEVEWEAYPGDLEDAIKAELRKRGYNP